MRKRKDHALEFAEDGGDGERLDIWQRLSRVLVALFMLVLIGLALSMFWPQIDQHRALDQQVMNLTLKRDELQGQRDRLEKRLEWLATDAAYLETIARDRLDMAKEGEVIIRIDRGQAGEVGR